MSSILWVTKNPPVRKIHNTKQFVHSAINFRCCFFKGEITEEKKGVLYILINECKMWKKGKKKRDVEVCSQNTWNRSSRCCKANSLELLPSSTTSVRKVMSLLYVSVNISSRKPPKCQTGTRHGLTALQEKITLLCGSSPLAWWWPRTQTCSLRRVNQRLASVSFHNM